MLLSWWDIPGPRRFVTKVDHDLRDRVNVVAALPTGLGRKWFDFFRSRWAFTQERMDVLRVTTETTSPISKLCGAFTTHPKGTITIKSLTQEEGFRGRTIGVLIDEKKLLMEWMEFLTAYSQECRLVEELDRTVFLIVTEGFSPRLLASPETYLRIHTYEGYARPHDCYMYAWILLGAEERQDWQTELKMALCAHLAQWDPRLCEVLCNHDIGSILQPESSIAVLPIGLDLDAHSDVEERWAMGILQRRDGQHIYHSGCVAKDTKSQEFQRRVWAAQVQVVFPLIEQVRRQAIERYGSRIRLPILVGEGQYVNDLYELEIAMVRRVISQVGGIPREVLRLLDQAWEFRNALAHLQPLSAQQLQAFDPSLSLKC